LHCVGVTCDCFMEGGLGEDGKWVQTTSLADDEGAWLGLRERNEKSIDHIIWCFVYDACDLVLCAILDAFLTLIHAC